MLPEEPRLDKQVRGTRYLINPKRREIINAFAKTCEDFGAKEIVLPSLEMAEIYEDKAGSEILGQMYIFQDRVGRELCLRPEGTASCQLLADKYKREAKIWYETRCWRYERPQKGRYREFTQLGLEIINPKQIDLESMIGLADDFVRKYAPDAILSKSAKRGLAYYKNGQGFEISIPRLGAQAQVLGGGIYDQGYGFAIGLDRLLLAI